MFFVERASQIMDLINAIIDAIATIASGSANAAAAIENALARSLPVAISFLASILGLGDISDKIKSILKKIQAPINKAIEWVLNLAKKTVGAIKGFLGGGKDKDKSQDKDGKEETAADPQVEEQAQAGFAAINAEEQKYMEDGKISKENAEKVARNIKAAHPVFKKFAVVDSDDSWDYDVEYNPKNRKKGKEKLKDNSKNEKIKEDITYKLTQDKNAELLKLGPFASDAGSIPTDRSTNNQKQRDNINELGPIYGCHHTGNKNLPKYYADHMPITRFLNIAKENKNEDNEIVEILVNAKVINSPEDKQRLYPQDPEKSHKQGGSTSAIIEKLKKQQKEKK